MPKLAGQAVLIVCIAGLVIFFAASKWIDQSPGAIKALILSGLICLIAALISMIPIAYAHQRQSDWLPQACLGATAIRLLMTLAAGMIVFATVIDKASENFFAIITVCFYMTLLMWETITAIKFAKRLYKDSPID